MHFSSRLAGVSFILVCAVALFGCSPKQSDTLVAKVGNNDVTLKDYENLYLRSSGDVQQAAASTQEEREKFLDLMTKFKLKLMDAYDQGLDKNPEIRKEIAQYKGSLVASYLTEREVTAPGIRKLYNDRQTEVRVSHILLSLASNASPADSENAYKKAYDLIAKLNAGASFESLAVANSNDPSVNQNKGDIYYFTAGRLVPEFEEAALQLKPGEITQKPVRTVYGLHIIKCVDRKPASGEIRASHIMIRFDKENPSPEDTLAAYNKIKLIQDSVNAGIDFADLAIRNSQDPGSAPRGGDLGWFGRARWVQPFDEEAFKLRTGQVSDIVRTMYGYHLIRCYDKRPPKSFDEAKKDLQQVYQQTRFQRDYNKFLDKLKAQTQYSMNDTVENLFVVAFDSLKTTRDSAWSSTLVPDLGKRPLFRFGPRTVSCDSVVSIMKERPDMAGVPLTSGSLRQQLGKIGEQLIFQVKGETIEREYPEFASLMKEYVDGILLYQIEQDRVWSKVAVNDTLLHEYFDANRDKFMWPDRVDFASVSTYSDSLANIVYESLRNGKTLRQLATEDSTRMKQPNAYRITFAQNSAKLSGDALKSLVQIAADLKSDPLLRVHLIARPDTARRKAQAEKIAAQRLDAVKNQLNKKLGVDAGDITTATLAQQPDTAKAKQAERMNMASEISVEIVGRRSRFLTGVEQHLLPVSTDERTMKADSLTTGAFSRPFNYKGNFTIVQLNGKEPSRQKTFEEAGTEISSAFQDYESKRLEQEWLDRLRKRYPVVEYKEALKNAFVSSK